MIKNYNGLSKAENYEVNLNRICNSVNFKNYVSSRHNVCPSGLTISCTYNENNNCLNFVPEIKHYGYDSVSNNGTAFTDLGDYIIGEPVSKEIALTMLEYFKLNEIELYNIMMNNFVV